MKLRNALLAATVMVALRSRLQAQAVDGLYIGAGAGGNILQTENIHSNPGGPLNLGHGTNLRYNAGPVVVGSVGYGFAGLFPGSDPVRLPGGAPGCRLREQAAQREERWLLDPDGALRTTASPPPVVTNTSTVRS